MGFPESVANEAIVLCERCCCICHKFCGTKIELHHIKQKAYGGGDTLDNCIPLCFDCHSDMGKADPKHPKGKRYSEEELIRHRDRWYKKVANFGGTSSNGEVSEGDVDNFKSICAMFTLDIKYWLKEADIGGWHPYHIFNPFFQYLHICDDPFSEFTNAEMEKLRGNLISSIEQFLSFKSNNTFVRTVGEKDICVTRLWMDENENGLMHTMKHDEYSAQYDYEAQELNRLASSVWDSYCEFVRHGRRILNI